MHYVILTSSLLLLALQVDIADSLSSVVVETWPGAFRGRVTIPIAEEVRDGWTVDIVFNKRVRNLQIWLAQITDQNGPYHYSLRNNDWNPRLDAGSELTLEFIGDIRGRKGAIGEVTFNKVIITPPPSPEGEEPDLSTCSAFTELTVLNEWQGHFKGKVEVTVASELNNGWTAVLSFSKPVRNLQIWTARVVRTENHDRIYYLKNENWNSNLPLGKKLIVEFIGQVQGSAASFSFRLSNQLEECACGPDAEQGCSLVPSTTRAPLPTTKKITTLAPQPTTQRVTTAVLPSTTSKVTTIVPKTSVKVETEKPPKSPTPVLPYTTEMRGDVTMTSDSSSTGSPESTSPIQSLTNSDESASTSSDTNPESTSSSPITPFPYDYPEVLHKSILFYEAQRSGFLPDSNRIPYRGDSATEDQGQNGEDLTGGWYDAGDFVKFGFPMASSATNLAWGLVEFMDAYNGAGELENALDSLKWATDYFIKCHVGPNEFYAQVGDGHVDHSFWGRPEEMPSYRPAFKVDSAHPGSDVAGETAAALAAASIVFRSSNDPQYDGYADVLLQNAEELFHFANRYQGKYSDSVTNAGDFYRSSGYNDELAWAAAWLYRATGELGYLELAEIFYDAYSLGSTPWAFSWDDKTAGVQVLLYQATRASKYKQHVQNFLGSWRQENGFQYTPQGLAWRDQWGSNRYAANSALIALMAAKERIETASNFDFAEQQIHYMLGDTGRSFVVGFGVNPPNAPHHSSSSCPSQGTCDWSNFHAPGPNPQVLYGALVGGPDLYDNFNNDRTDYVQNEVTTDYNAGFQSAVAGLMYFRNAQLSAAWTRK